ncbi:MAG: glycosyl hydrolase, partial [Bacteroidales bacterium]
LDIHRGDKMNYLVSMDTKAVNIPNYIQKVRNEDLGNFKNGDHMMTMIRTEKGKTMQIQHNVATPRPYSRMYQLTGTKGFANKYPMEGYLFENGQLDQTMVKNHENLNSHRFVPEDTKKELMDKYKHPIHRELEETAKKVGGHGGMDYIMDYRLIYCLRNGLPLDMDVYDLAEWCCLAPLTRLSLENGSVPVAIPDFTRGHWNDVQGYRHALN